MPEGHTIHRTARRHRELFGGEPVRVSSPQGRFDAGARRLDGRVLQDVDAHGKHLFYEFEGRRTLHIHLGLVGRFRTHDAPAPDPGPATRLVLKNERGAAHLSGPMTCELLDRSEVDLIVGALGPDPLRHDTDAGEFARRLEEDDRPIGEVLLDQSVIAGIGNVYRSEILFLTGIDPHQPASELDDDQAETIWKTARDELGRGVETGRIVTVAPRDVGASRRRELPTQLTRYAYKRGNRPCLRCRTMIDAAQMGGRTIWWCRSCQGVDTREA